MIKIATWNVNSLNVRLPHVLQWVEDQQPDILALQETKTIDANFPREAIEEIGYHVIYSGQKTYNGMAILSKTKPKAILADIPELVDPQRRILMATFADVRLINLYVPNGESVDSEKYTYKLDWLQKVTAFVQQQFKKYPKLVVVGDFNIAPEDRDVYNPKTWAGKVLCSQPERDAFQAFIALGLTDCLRLFEQPDKCYSWWDYRMLAFQKGHGLRIDHILASPTMATGCKACEINKAPRKWKRPSDHAPVIAQFVISQ